MNLFGKRPKRIIEDHDFGRIEEYKKGQWEGKDFRLWGYASLHVLIDSDSEGPLPEQRAFVQALRSEPRQIRERIESAVVELSKKTSSAKGPLKLTGICLPRNLQEQKWRVWYDLEGEDIIWYGAEILGWEQIIPFAED